MLYLKQSTASQSVLIGPFVDDTDGATAETGLTIANTDIRLSKNGGNLAAKNSGGGTHDEAGWYQITLDATDTDTVGMLQLHVKVSGALMVHHEFQVLEETVYDALFASSAAGELAVKLSAQGKLDVNAEADTALTDYDAVVPADLPTNFADLSITATTGRVDVASIEGSDATDQINAACDTALTDMFTSSAQLVDDIWDEDITGANHNVNGSSARFVREGAEAAGVTGTAQAGADGTITLAAGESATDDIYNGERISILEGTGAGQSRLIVDYDGTSKVATVDRNWTINPLSGSLYSIRGADADIRAVEGSDTAADNLLAMFDGTGYAGGTTNLDVNVVSVAGTSQTARDLGASVLLSSGTGTGQVSLSSGTVSLTADQSGVTIGTVNTLTGHTAQTGDNFARLGAPAGASVSADIAAVKVDTAATLADTGTDGVVLAGTPDVNVAQISGDATAADNLEASLEGVVAGQAQTGTLSTTQATTNLTEATDDHYNGRYLVFRTGALAGQATDITDYDGTSKMLTFTALTEAPGNGDTFVIL